MDDSKSIYERRIVKFTRLLEKQTKVMNTISFTRMAIFIIGVLVNIICFCKWKNKFGIFSIFLIFIVAFIYAVIQHDRIINKKRIVEALIRVNELSIKRIDGDWKEFDDNGEEYLNGEHSYAGDLDIFGKASLFQYVNETSTYMGKVKLRDTLSQHRFSIDEIYKRQEAIKELSFYTKFRQRFSAQRFIKKGKEGNLDKLISWSENKELVDVKGGLKILTKWLPTLTILLIILYFIGVHNSYYIPLMFLAIQYVILKVGKNKRDELLDTLNFYSKTLNDYHFLFEIIENKNFKCDYLKNMQSVLKDEKGNASNIIKELSNLSNIVSDRKNFMYMLFNVLTLWDYRLAINLDNWKIKYASNLKDWLNVLGEIDALSSLSTVAFDNSSWCYPKFTENDLLIKGVNMAHPLLSQNKVSNNINIGKDEKVLLITGSNMSGKSTFLRTAGINLVLAYTGAPVCASGFYCSIMDIYTCMRISDNLEKNISSFYGELLRIKGLMEAIKEGKPVFFLLDEIFKGTNSIDRHTGAKVLINKLTKENAIGMVSTHDLELGELEKENNKVKNYHLREYYKNNKIAFDYKVRPGVSTTRNAIYLMKMAGIDME